MRSPVRRHLRHVLRLVVGLILLAGSPRAAHACIWNPAHNFNPWPPCEVKDENLIRRLNQENVRIAGKLTTVAVKLREVATEIQAWQGVYTTAKTYRAHLLSVYGSLTANPLPSLIASYQATPMNVYVRMDAQGNLRVADLQADFRAAADSLWQAFRDSTNLKKLYRDGWAPMLKYMQGDVMAQGRMLSRQITALGDYRLYSRQVLDSMTAMSNRLGRRYENTTEGGGKAEADISGMQASLARLRGTAFEAQAASIQARMQALDAATEKSRALQSDQAVAPGYFRY